MRVKKMLVWPQGLRLFFVLFACLIASYAQGQTKTTTFSTKKFYEQVQISNSINDPDVKWYMLLDRERTKSADAVSDLFLLASPHGNRDVYVNYGPEATAYHPYYYQWAFVKAEKEGWYYLYNRAMGPRVAVHRAHDREQINIPGGQYPGYGVFLWSTDVKTAVTPSSPAGGGFQLMYLDTNNGQTLRIKAAYNTRTISFGQTAQDDQRFVLDAIPVAYDGKSPYDYYALINAAGMVGGLPRNMVQDLVQKHFAMVQNPTSENEYALRLEADRLRTQTTDRVAFQNGNLYRIRLAHLGFFDPTQSNSYPGGNSSWKKPVLIDDNGTMKWRNSENTAALNTSPNAKEELWVATVGGNTWDGKSTKPIVLTNVATGKKFNLMYMTDGNTQTSVEAINAGYYPGHYRLSQTGYMSMFALHATNHQVGAGTSGTTESYTAPDYNIYDFALSGTGVLPGASVWMFEPAGSLRLTPEEETQMKALLNAKNVVDGFTAAQLANFENLEDQYKQGNSSAELLSSLRAEISRLINLPYTDRIQWKNGFYAIKNGHINLYERETNELMLLSTKPFEATGEFERPGVEVLDWNRRPTTAQGANAEEVWYVEKLANGKMVFTNMKTLARIESFTGDYSNVSMLTGKGSEVTTSQPDQRNRPGQFKLTAADGSVAHPYGHNNGVVNGTNGTQGNIGSYDNNDLFSAWMLRQLDPANVSDPQGANHKITSVPAEAGKVKGYFLASEGVEGGYTTDELKKLSDAGNDPYDVTRAIAEIRSNGTRIGSVEGLLRIYSAASDVRTKPGYGHIHVSYTANGTTVNNAPAWSYNDMTRADEIWEVKSTGSSTQPQERTLMSVNTGKYMSSVTGSMSDDANARKALIKAIDPFLYPGLFEIVLNHAGAAQNVHPGGHGNGATAQGSLANWRRGRPQDEHHLSWATGRYATDYIDEFSTFYFKKATEVHVKHNANTQWVTFNYPFAVSLREATAGRDVAEGIWLVGERNYSKTGSDAMLRPDHVKVSPIVGVQHIAANTPVILEYSAVKAADANLFKLDIKYGADANGLSLTNQTTANSVWQGNTAPIVLANSEWVMVNTATFKGFRKAATNLLMPANKVFISGNSLPAAAKSLVFVWDLEDNATTGIHQVENNGTEKEVIYYDLSGRRVSNPTKGVYVTSEGKKVVLQ